MKIAMISHHFPPSFNSGAEQYAYRIARMLIKMGHQVEVVCIESITQGSLEPLCKTDLYEGIPVHRLYFNLAGAPDSLELLFRNPHLGAWVKEYLEQTAPDLVHFNSGYLIGGTVIEAAYELNIPSILTLHEYWFLCPTHTLIRSDGQICETACPPARCAWCYLSGKRRYRIPDQLTGGKLGDLFVGLSQSGSFAKWSGVQPLVEMISDRQEYLKSVLAKVDIVLSPSRFLIQKFKDFGFDEKEIAYLPFGLDTANLTPEPCPPQSEVFRIGYLGQYAHHKGVHLLIDAFERLDQSGRKCTLTLHGRLTRHTAYGAQILKSIQGREDIAYAGSYNNAELCNILSEIDLVVVPSIWYENRPTIIVEAMAMKVPVLASRIGGIVELIQDGKDGLLFEPGNVDELTQQLQRFLDDATLQPRLHEGIQPVIRIEDEMEKLVALYASLAPEKSQQSSIVEP